MNMHFHKQKAIALPVTLVTLLTISMIAIFGMKQTISEFKIVSNTQVSQNLFNVALSETEAMHNFAKNDFNTFRSTYLIEANSSTVDNEGQLSYPEVSVSPIGAYKQKKLQIDSKLNKIGETSRMIHGSTINMMTILKFRYVTEAKIDKGNNYDRRSKQLIHLEYESLVSNNGL